MGGLAGRMSALHHALEMLASPVVDTRKQIFTELGNGHHMVRYLLLQSVYTNTSVVCESGMGDGVVRTTVNSYVTIFIFYV